MGSRSPRMIGGLLRGDDSAMEKARSTGTAKSTSIPYGTSATKEHDTAFPVPAPVRYEHASNAVRPRERRVFDLRRPLRLKGQG